MLEYGNPRIEESFSFKLEPKKSFDLSGSNSEGGGAREPSHDWSRDEINQESCILKSIYTLQNFLVYVDINLKVITEIQKSK
jgi:hypothetical protein